MKLLDQLRQEIRVRHYSIRTEKTYVEWTKDYIFYHGTRHPAGMGTAEIEQYLTHLAVDRNVAASTQNQALNALVFLYRNVLKKDLPEFTGIVRAKRPARLPVVLSPREVQAVLAHVPPGTKRLMCELMYGTGMRIIEVVRLRVKDIDFERNQITVREGKGQKDRTAILPKRVIPLLQRQLGAVKRLHDKDLAAGFGRVYLPYALEQKYPNANRAWEWQYVFPAHRLSVDPRSGRRQRHHVYETVLQKAIKDATKAAGICKPVHAHSFRHSFATTLLETGSDIRTVQELLGHKDVKTTMIYTHVLKTGPSAVTSPLDRLPTAPEHGEQKPRPAASGAALAFGETDERPITPALPNPLQGPPPNACRGGFVPRILKAAVGLLLSALHRYFTETPS